MIRAWNRKGALLSVREGNPFPAKVRLRIPDDTSMPYSGFEPKPPRLQAECHNHHTKWGGNAVHQKSKICKGRFI
ncbi:hypothetical protein TNCV_3701821 [Trichonephila clavipes]|nr:hypothetical protein TNCV_3701821 [Trichonephila clavipes]